MPLQHRRQHPGGCLSLFTLGSPESLSLCPWQTVREDWNTSVKEGSAPRDLTQTPLGFPLGLE